MGHYYSLQQWFPQVTVIACHIEETSDFESVALSVGKDGMVGKLEASFLFVVPQS